jgi:hypothetical protein
VTPSTHRELAQKLDELEQKDERHDAHIQEIFETISKSSTDRLMSTGRILEHRSRISYFWNTGARKQVGEYGPVLKNE